MTARGLFRDTEGKWAEVAPVEPNTWSQEAVAFQNLVGELVRMQRVVSLTGLGTSRCVRNVTMDDLWRVVQESAGSAFSAILRSAHYDKESSPRVETLLSRCEMANALEPDAHLQAFVDGARAAIGRACQFPELSDQTSIHEAFLQKTARRPVGLARLKLFTTNYDLCFETAASRCHFITVDGFSHTLPQEFDAKYFEYEFIHAKGRDVVPNVLQLYKLHGSVDWQAASGKVVRERWATDPLIIYPETSKVARSLDSPFLHLMRDFHNALNEPLTALIVVGSGLNDEHITKPLMAAIEGNKTLHVAIVATGLQGSSNVVVQAVERLILSGDRRLALCDMTFEEFVKLMPECMPPTEADKHEGRVRALSAPEGTAPRASEGAETALAS